MDKEIIERVALLADEDDYWGICILCGYEMPGIEPDVEKDECEKCGGLGIYGVEQIVLVGKGLAWL